MIHTLAPHLFMRSKINQLYELKVDALLSKIAPHSYKLKHQAARRALPQAYLHLKNINLACPYNTALIETVALVAPKYLTKDSVKETIEADESLYALKQASCPTEALESYLEAQCDSALSRRIEAVYLKVLKEEIGDDKFNAIFSHEALKLNLSSGRLAGSLSSLSFFTAVNTHITPFMRCRLGSSYFIYSPSNKPVYKEGLEDDFEADHISLDMVSFIKGSTLESLKEPYFPERMMSHSLEYTFRDYIKLNLKPE